MKTIITAIALFITFTSMAQTAPSAVANSFAKRFPNTTVKKWDKEGEKWEANFIKEGKTMSATFTSNGTWEETETDIKISELPTAVADYVKANYKGANIKEAAVIERGNQKMYEAEVKGKDVLFDTNGKFLKEEKD